MNLFIGGVHQIPDGLNLTGNLVNVLLRRDAGCLGLLLNLLTMLVRAGLEVNVVTGHALVACDSVGQHDLVGVADVRASPRYRRSPLRYNRVSCPFVYSLLTYINMFYA